MGTHWQASADAGNGGTNVFAVPENGKVKRFYEPSVRANATGDTLGLKGLEIEYVFVDWGGSRFVTGDDVVRVSQTNLERHMGENRYGEEFHQFLVANALARLGVKDGDTVDLMLFAPPALYGKAQQDIVNSFGENGGEVKIKLKGDKKVRVYHYTSIHVLPEGLGGAFCYILDEDGNPISTDILNGEVVILDIGAFTLDALRVQNGKLNPNDLQSATWQKAGVHEHIRLPLLRMIQKKDPDFSVLTVDHMDEVIRRGFSKGDYMVKSGSQEMDVKIPLKNLQERYADWVANVICDGVFDGFKGIKAVFLVGGGSMLVEEKLRSLYGTYNITDNKKQGKILATSKNPLVKGLTYADLNAAGGLRYLKMLREDG